MPASENARSAAVISTVRVPPSSLLAPRSLVQPAPRLLRAAHLPQRVRRRVLAVQLLSPTAVVALLR
jgi:hypothetical protein